MSVQLIKRSRIDNPDTGITWNLTFSAGSLAELSVARDSWVSQGFKTTSDESGGSLQFTVLAPEYDDSPNDFKDTFSLVTEQVPISIWMQPKLRAQIKADFPAAEELQAVAIVQRNVQACITKANSVNGFDVVNEFIPGTSPQYKLTSGSLTAYKIRISGVDQVNTRRIVLRRNRTIPVTSSSRMTVNGDDLIYTTSALGFQFGFPDVAKAMIAHIEDNITAAVPGFTWAWWLRDDETETIVGTGKAQERRSWVFSQWATALYTLISK